MNQPRPSASNALDATLPTLSGSAFSRIATLTRELCGISLRAGKEKLVQSRLARRLRATGRTTFEDYLELVGHDSNELGRMIDVLTTNKTNFFREPAHFDLLRDELLPVWAKRREPIRIWSAACSTGEEPHTIAMTILDAAPLLAPRVRILATDISTIVLGRARSGLYAHDAVAEVPDAFRRKYFKEVGARQFAVSPSVLDLTHFAQLNLLDDWPMQGPFHAIFCRNVMIYFDKDTQMSLAGRMRDLLVPGGLLLIGHSESLGPSVAGLQYERPAVYSRC